MGTAILQKSSKIVCWGRPFLLEPIIYRHTNCRWSPGAGPWGWSFKCSRSDSSKFLPFIGF